MAGEVAGNPSHMCSQTVTQQMNLLPRQLKLSLEGRRWMRCAGRTCLHALKLFLLEDFNPAAPSPHSRFNRVWEIIQDKNKFV